MGVTRFITIISSKGSGTYLFASECAATSLCDSSQWSPESGGAAAAWVRLVVADVSGTGKTAEEVGDGLWPKCQSPQSYFSKSCISRMMGIMR
jgi:hypothetical protein